MYLIHILRGIQCLLSEWGRWCMDSSNVEIIERLVRLETKIDDFKNDVASVQISSRSNENDIVALKMTVDTLKDKVSVIENKNTWLYRTSIGSIISCGVALLFAIIRLFIGI